MFPPEHPPAASARETESDAEDTVSPPPLATASSSSSSSGALLGAGAAKMEGSARDAVGVKLWVRLAQAPSHQMSALAAR